VGPAGSPARLVDVSEPGGGLSEATVAAATVRRPGVANRWWILAVVGLAQLMVVLDATIVNRALPSAQRSLGFSNADRQWVVTAYSLGFGGLLLLGGRLSDLLGRRRMFLIGLAGFAGASALGGLSMSFGMLVFARGLQGASGAMLAPAALSVLTTTFADPAERGKAFGVYGAIAGAGGAVGLLLGGILTEYLSWRWCLYVNVVFAGIALVGALRLLVNQPVDREVRLDWAGTILVVAGLVSLVYGFSRASTKGWGNPVTLACLALGVILLVGFVLIERRVEHPLLPLRIVLDRNRGGSYLAILFTGLAMFGIFLFLTYYLQLILGFSPVTTGLAFLPMVAALMIASTVSTAVLLPRVGPRPLVPVGMLVAGGGMALLTQLTLHTRYVTGILPSLLLIGLGLGLVFGCAMNMATYGAAPQDAGVASATVNTSQQIGGSIGTALLNTIAASATTSYLVAHCRSPRALAQASVHGDVVAFTVVVEIFITAAIVCAVVLAPGEPQPVTAEAAPAIA
jgi:EmrB/QacA subfamily drug resistance transporter